MWDLSIKHPDWLNSLVRKLLKFRQKKIGFCADIAKMFSNFNIKCLNLLPYTKQIILYQRGRYIKKG